MAARYLAIVGATAKITKFRAEDLAALLDFDLVMHLSNLWLLCEKRSTTLRSADGRHAVIGTLFRKGVPSARINQVPAGDADRVRRNLLTDYWGGYVSIWCDSKRARVHILRDPSGFQPCYYITESETTLLASDPHLLRQAMQGRLEIDFNYLHQYLASEDYAPVHTALRNVLELTPGSSIVVGGGQVGCELQWRPSSFASAPLPVPATEIPDILRAAIFDCVGSWTRKFPRAILTLSGGLDSSVVAAALAHASPEAMICVTGFTSDRAGDERRHARVMARTINAPLLEFRHDAVDTGDASLPFTGEARPTQRLSAQIFERYLDRCSNEYNASAIFDGFGGDNVFSLSRSGAALADHWLTAGLSLKTFRTIRDIGNMTGASNTDIVISAVAALNARRTRHRALPDLTFLLDPPEATGSCRHPWLDDMLSAPPGKYRHVRMIVRTHRYLHRPYNQWRCARISPLLSQPILELCLAIESWRWCGGGRDRAPVRNAFDGIIPDAILQRSAKGTPSSYYASVLVKQRARLRPLLLDGLLAANAVIARKEIETALGDDQIFRDKRFLRLLTIAEAEIWARNWHALI